MMAEDLDDGEFWLPPQFLSDDDDLFKNKKSTSLSSPGESTDTETEEDEFAELTRLLAQSTLSNDLWKLDHQKPKSWSMSRSPNSTLCNVMECGCGSKQGSSDGSPNCPSPPPSTKALGSETEASWNLLNAAAGEVAKIRMAEETGNAARGYYRNNAHFGILQKPGPIFVPQKESNNNNPGLGYYQRQAIQFEQKLVREQQKGVMPSFKAQQIGRNGGSSVWPTLQQSQSGQPGSGIRAVFLGNHVAKQQRTGTGVFLPQRVGTPTETRKKSGCSTVLLPNRVVQTLNLNMQAIEPHQQLHTVPNRTNAGLPYDYEAAIKFRNNAIFAQAQQRRNIARPAPVNNELRLPQEWTY